MESGRAFVHKQNFFIFLIPNSIFVCSYSGVTWNSLYNLGNQNVQKDTLYSEGINLTFHRSGSTRTRPAQPHPFYTTSWMQTIASPQSCTKWNKLSQTPRIPWHSSKLRDKWKRALCFTCSWDRTKNTTCNSWDLEKIQWISSTMLIILSRLSK